MILARSSNLIQDIFIIYVCIFLYDVTREIFCEFFQRIISPKDYDRPELALTLLLFIWWFSAHVYVLVLVCTCVQSAKYCTTP